MLKRFSVIGLIHTRPAIKYSCFPKTRVSIELRRGLRFGRGKQTEIPVGICATLLNSVEGKYTFSHTLALSGGETVEPWDDIDRELWEKSRLWRKLSTENVENRRGRKMIH